MRHVRRVILTLTCASLPIAAVTMAEEPHTRVVVIPTAQAVFDAQAPDSGTFVPSSIAPDPAPIVSREQWIWDLRWSKGDVFLLAVQAWDTGAPRATPRAMGRFAIELYARNVLIERVRFDFPGLGAPETDAGHFALPSMQAKLTTRIGVIFPQTSKGSKLELVDRATNERWALPWPPHGDAGP